MICLRSWLRNSRPHKVRRAIHRRAALQAATVLREEVLEEEEEEGDTYVQLGTIVRVGDHVTDARFDAYSLASNSIRLIRDMENPDKLKDLPR